MGTTNKASVKISGIAATMSGATAAKNLNNGKTDKISTTGKKTTTGTTKKSAATTATQNTAATDTSGAGNKDILLQWKGVQFFANASKVVGFSDLKINASCETEDTEDGGEKYVSLKNKKGFEVSFKAYLDRRLGVDDVRSDAIALANFAATGDAGYIYCCGDKLVPCNMMATSGKIADVRMTPGGTWISCEVQMTLKSCGKLEGLETGGGPAAAASANSSGSSGGSYTATVSYSASSGAVSTVSATSTVSYADALKKAYAKVPKNAQWAHEEKSKATNQQKISTAAQQQQTAKDKSSSGGGLFSQFGEVVKYKQNTGTKKSGS